MDPNFPHDLIKGKIAETIFELMFRESNKFTLIPIGYEHTTPELAQYQHLVQVQKVLENLRAAPDFALITQDKKQVYLVEVKYRNTLNNDEIVKTAKELQDKWDPCYIFVATREGFYFEPCHTIINFNGVHNMMKDNWINNEIQQKYLGYLREFVH
jgi:hypothetical protein